MTSDERERLQGSTFPTVSKQRSSQVNGLTNCEQQKHRGLSHIEHQANWLRRPGGATALPGRHGFWGMQHAALTWEKCKTAKPTSLSSKFDCEHFLRRMTRSNSPSRVLLVNPQIVMPPRWRDNPRMENCAPPTSIGHHVNSAQRKNI